MIDGKKKINYVYATIYANFDGIGYNGAVSR